MKRIKCADEKHRAEEAPSSTPAPLLTSLNGALVMGLDCQLSLFIFLLFMRFNSLSHARARHMRVCACIIENFKQTLLVSVVLNTLFNKLYIY